VLSGAIGTLAVSNVLTHEPAENAVLFVAVGGLLAAAFANRAGNTTVATLTVFVAALVTAAMLVFEARDGFRSHAMLIFPGLLLISVMFMDRASYALTAAMVLITVAVLGVADKFGYMRAIPGFRSLTSYDSILIVDVLLLLIALIGSRIARNIQSNTLDLHDAVADASRVNRELGEAAEAARQREQELVSIYNTVQDAIFRLEAGPDEKFRFVSVNDAFLRITGLSRDAVIGKTVREVIPETSLAMVLGMYRKAMEERTIVCWEETSDYPSGRLTGEVTIAPVFGDDGACRHLVGSVHDVTERKNTEAALRASEERFRRVFEEGPLGLALVERNYRFSNVNRTLCEMVGYSENELVEKSFADITHPDDLDTDLELARRLMAGEMPFYRLEKRYVKKNGEIIWIHLTASMLRDERGEPLHGLAMVEDVTETKHNREEAFARQKLESIGLLARGIAHDFNNLMGGVLAETEVAEMEVHDGDSPLETIRRIRSVALRGAEIVRELMLYSGQDEEDPLVSTDVSALVREMRDLLKTSIPKHVGLSLELSENLPPVMGKPSQLRQVVMNLIINASEAVGERTGTITVTTSRQMNSASQPRECLKLEVRDTGAGMTDEVKARIFEPFFSTKAAGRGMGLAVLERVIRDHEGTISVGTAPGQGTKFEILLPALSEADPARRGGATPVAPIAHVAPRRTVLLVEDEEVLRMAISRLLRNSGFNVIDACDGLAALDLIRDGPAFDVLVLDMSLPGVSSREVLDQARRLRSKLEVIITSAYSKGTVEAFFNGPPIERFLRKPFEFQHLVDMLGSLPMGRE